jgi:hypothetical protein
MFEHRRDPLLSRRDYLRRLLLHALFSGVAFLTTVGVLLSPVVHRALHKFHLESRPAGQ